MNNENIIRQIETVKRNYLLEINSWTTIGALANKSGTIITNDKRVYNYTLFYNEEKASKENAHSYFEEVYELNPNQYQTFINFINEENLINQPYEKTDLQQAGFNIYININNNEKIIENCISFDPNNPKIYDKLLLLIRNTLN
ncbi:MAG: hypothetical protein J6B89_01360 [Bacilli bacterium]|nr:hypothetical protein [Bacilli bacterium]